MTTLTREEIQRLYGSSAYQVTDNDEVIIEADEFIGKLTGTADKAIALANPYNLKLIGDASGEITLNNTSKQMQVSVSHATNADNATHATSADNATRTTYCDLANLAHYAYRCSTALLASRSLVADNAITANDAIHADSADTATSASRATYDASGNEIDTTFASHNDRISRNATKNTQQDLRLDDLENYTELKEWKATTTYKKDKVVVYQDNLYRSKVNNNLNHIPTETDSQYWKLLSETAGGGTADCVHINDTETITGDKTFTGLLIANTQQQSDNSQKVATTSYVQSAVNAVATNVYTKAETYNKTETYSKTETNNLVIPKADNDSVVHLASAETITGNKTFSNGALLIMPQNPTANDVVNKDYVDNHAVYLPNQIIVSPVPMSDANLHLLDGSLLTSGVYAEYVAMMISLYNADPTATCWTTESNWQASVSTYGECGKFVVDTVNETVRLPKLTSFIQATSTASELGSLTEAGVPNVTGSFGNTTWNSDGTASSGAFQYQEFMNYGVPAASNKGTTFTFDASRSSPVYGKSNTVQPQSIKYYYYIVVGTVSKTPIQVDIDNIATDLNGKADRSLSNVDNTANILMAHNAMPSHTNDTLTLGASGATYTAPADGYFTIHVSFTPQYGYMHLVTLSATTGVIVLYQLLKGGPIGTNYGSFIPVQKGDMLQVHYENITDLYYFGFVYAVGSESEQV